MAYREDPRSYQQQQPRGGGGGRAPASYGDIDESHYSSRGGRDLGRERGGYDDRRGGGGGGGGYDRGYDRAYDRRDDYSRRDDRDRRGGDYRQPDARRRSRSPPPRRRDDDYSRDHRRSRSPPPSRYDSSHSNNRAPVPPRSDAGSARSRDDNDRVPAPRDAPREERNGKGNAKDKRERSPSPVTADDAADVDAAAMAAMMGFSGFDTTSHKHVQDDLAAVAIKQPRTHRQYMNRKGGFNRPLDRIK